MCSVLLDGGHIAQTAGESFQPSFFPAGLCLIHILKNEHGSACSHILKQCWFRSGQQPSPHFRVPASYGLARFKSRMISVLLFIFWWLVLPSSLILTPLLFVNFNKPGLINNHLGVILSDATITIPFVVIILRHILRRQELEAAIIGCGPEDVIRIMVSINYPGIVTATSMACSCPNQGDMILLFLNREAKDPAADSLQGHGRAGSQMEI